ncbi:MAG: hypothetical protein PF637_03060 [Spirochaetes bacterium]|jgi:hypothetical protein|nr:hypothetical protein [Spirochaetota bacterium]
MTGTMTTQSSIYLSRQLNVTARKLGEQEIMTLIKKAESLLDKQKSKNRPVKNNPYAITVLESDDGSSFRIFIGNTPKVFQRYEMRKMVKLCYKSCSSSKAVQKLTIWLKNNRPDFFLDHRLGNSWDTALHNLYKFLINNYTVQ